MGQTKIMGFLEVDQLITLCNSTEYTTYKIYQAVKAGDIHYKAVMYVRTDMGLREALKQMILKRQRYAVVKKGSREVGMIGESIIRDALGQDKTTDLGDLSNDSLSQQRQYKPCDFKGAAAAEGSSRSILYDGSEANRISIDRGGNEISQIRAHKSFGASLDYDDIKSFGLDVQADAASNYREKGLHSDDQTYRMSEIQIDDGEEIKSEQGNRLVQSQ